MTRELLKEAVEKCCESLINNGGYQGADAVLEIMAIIDMYAEAKVKNLSPNNGVSGRSELLFAFIKHIDRGSFVVKESTYKDIVADFEAGNSH